MALLILTAFAACGSAKTETEPEYHVIGPSAATAPSDNYYYNALSDEEKRGYDKIKQSAADFVDYVTFDDKLTDYQISKLFRLVYTQENSIFWLSEVAAPNQTTNSIKMTFRYNPSDVKYMQSTLDDKVQTIIDGAPEKDAFVQILYIHDYIVLNSTFVETSENSNSAYGALIDGKAQCEGYAFAFGMLAKKLGFKVVTVTGTSKTGESHAWNKIFAGENWYNVDCTWDDPEISFDNPKYLRHFYMCVPDRDIMGISHFEDTTYVNAPAAISMEYNYFTRENLLFSSSEAGEKSVSDQIAKIQLTRGTECEVRFDNEKAYLNAKNDLFKTGGLKAAIDRINKEKNANIDTCFHSEDDNLYIIHISLVYKK
jgi:hypothetical protein